MSDYPSRGGRPDPEAWRPQSRSPRPQASTSDYGSDGGDRYGASDGYGPSSRSRSGGSPAPAGPPSARSGGTRSAGRAVESPDEGGGSRGARLGSAFLVAAIPAAVIVLAAGALASGGSAKSIAGVSLNSKLLELTGLGLIGGLAVIAGLLRWRKVEPLGLTWTYGMIAGLSWLGLLFMAQVKDVIPHLPPLASVPLIAGAAFAAGAALTDDATTGTGRYGLLAAVVVSHIGIVAIVVTIVLA